MMPGKNIPEVKKKKLSEMSLEELWQLFPIILTCHNDAWKVWYDEEASEIAAVLPEENIERISHIGSTAVKGISAKPIVDILVELKKDSNMEAACRLLCDAGWICMSRGNGRISLNKGYTENGFAERVFHLHLRYAGDNDEICFRDYLNTHPDTVREYEKLKLGLWKKYEHDRDGYTAAESEFVEKYTEIAGLEIAKKIKRNEDYSFQ